MRERFWERYGLGDLSREEWEALCDGCGKCCLHTLEDEETGHLYRTRVACRLLDPVSCRCSDYGNRKARVPDCVSLRPGLVSKLDWLPSTCAYVRLDRGLPLPEWHHLVCGQRERIHAVGASVRGWTVCEDEAGDLEDHIIGQGFSAGAGGPGEEGR